MERGAGGNACAYIFVYKGVNYAQISFFPFYLVGNPAYFNSSFFAPCARRSPDTSRLIVGVAASLVDLLQNLVVMYQTQTQM